MVIASELFHDPQINSWHIYLRLKEFAIVEWKSSLIRSIRLSEILLDIMGHTKCFLVFWALLLEWNSIYYIPQMFWPLIYQAKIKFNGVYVHVEESYIQDDY